MTVGLGDGTITLTGTCGVEEVETLVGYLESQPGLPVDLSAATAIHTALWQALMVFRPNFTGARELSQVPDKILSGLHVYFDETREP